MAMIDLVKIASIREVLSRNDGRLGAAASKQSWTDAEITELRALAIKGLLARYFEKPRPKQEYHVHPADRDLQPLIQRAVAFYDAMTPEQKKAHDDAQRESWVRGEMALEDCSGVRRMVPDEMIGRPEPCLHQRATHGLDFSYCPDCGKYSDTSTFEKFDF